MKKKLFTGKTNYFEIKKVINNSLDDIVMFSNNENIEAGLKSFSRLNESSRLISIANYVDENYKSGAYKKIPIILTASIILDRYSNIVSTLSDKSIISIADFSYLTTPDNLEKFMNIFSEDILNEIDSKSNSSDDFINYMYMVEDKYCRLSGQNVHKELISYIRNITDSDLKKYLEDSNKQMESIINREGIKF